MEPDESDDVRELLEYNEDTAGGMMTTDYVSVPVEMTAGQALAHLRAMEEQPDMVYYFYVVERGATAPAERTTRTATSPNTCGASSRCGNWSLRRRLRRSPR